MAKTLFVTGTGTDVGKTFVSALILKRMKELGKNIGYYKAAISGATSKEDSDAGYVSKISGVCDSYVSYLYSKAVSPHLASRLEGDPVDMDVVKRDFLDSCDRNDYVCMEGSGGIICPIRYDDEIIMLEDIIKAMDLGVIIVSGSEVGCINDTVLTVEHIRRSGIEIRGVIMNHYDEGNVVCSDNKKMIEVISGASVIGVVVDGSLVIDDEVLLSIFK